MPEAFSEAWEYFTADPDLADDGEASRGPHRLDFDSLWRSGGSFVFRPPPSAKARPEPDDDLLARMYRAGWVMVDICRCAGLGAKAVRRRLRAAGVAMRPVGDRLGQYQGRRLTEDAPVGIKDVVRSDPVVLATPGNPRLDGTVAAVAEVLEWGCRLLAPAAATGEYRAMWSEMRLPASLPAPQLAGYSGDVCQHCQGSRMRRSGSCLHCDDCGSTSGCS